MVSFIVHQATILLLLLLLLLPFTLSFCPPFPSPSLLSLPPLFASNPPSLITCASTLETQRACDLLIREGDAVLELGAQLQSTSLTIAKSAGVSGSVLQLDIRRKMPTGKKADRMNFARKGSTLDVGGGDADGIDTNASTPGLASCTFVELPTLESYREVIREHASKKFDVYVLDIQAMTGNDLPTQIETISTIRDLLAVPTTTPSTVIIKSGALNTLAWRLVHSQRLFDGTETLPLDDQDLHHPTYPNRGNSTDRPPMPSLHRLPPIVATVGVENYRKTIPFTVRSGDVVLEVGCHAGTTTNLLTAAAGEDGGAVGVDIGPSILEQARKNYPETKFAVGDAWRTGELARLRTRFFPPPPDAEAASPYDVIFVDVGGLSGADGLLDSLSLLDGLSYALEPRAIVIKSLCVRRLASSLRPFAKVWWKRK